VTEEEIRQELARAACDVIDPETGLNIVDMGLVFVIDYVANTRLARVEMTFTTPYCPSGEVMVRGLEHRFRSVEGVDDVHIDVTFDEPWTPERITSAGRAALGWR
jgi:metal-sulfur cluster biosynthetic enzyme